MKSLSALFQLISTIVGVLSTTIFILKGYRDLRRAPATAVPEENNASSLTSKPATRRDNQDLALALLISAVLSLVAVHSVLFAGRIPTISYYDILTCLGITIVSSGAAFLAWYFGVQEKVLLLLAMTVSAIVIFSRSGPLSIVSQLGSVADNGEILLPLLVLTAIMSCLIIRAKQQRNSDDAILTDRKPLALIALIIGICSVAQGRWYLQDVLGDERAPKSPSEAAKVLLSDVSSRPADQQKAFYRLASEIQLETFYAGQYNVIEDRLSNPSSKSSGTLGKGLFGSLLSGSDKDGADSQELVKPPLPQQNPLSYIPLMYTSYSTSTQADYLLQRLEWVYPLGSPSSLQAQIGLPGVSTQQRLENTADARIMIALQDQALLRHALLPSFEYSSTVRSLFAQKEGKQDQLTQFASLYAKILGGGLTNRIR